MIYLDNNSTTKLDPRVMKAMEPFFSDRFGNPSSAHDMGEDAKGAIEIAREQVASLINANSEDVYFTNSATEANNIILKGFYNKNDKDYIKIISTNSEHNSILKTLEKLPNTINQHNLKINKDGNLNLDGLEKHIWWIRDIYYLDPIKILVSVIAANNEIGTIHDLKQIGDICNKTGALFHTDATQAIGKVDIDVDEMNIFALTLSAHKIYGPKGVGALYIRDVDLVEPLIDGGYQNILSSGTQNVPAIVGFGEACRILQQEGQEENKRIEILRNKLLVILQQGIPDIIINGTMINRLSNNLNVSIPNVPSEALIKGIGGDVIISGGAACASGDIEPSHVITALGTPHPDCAIRFGLGRWTTEKEINYATKRIIEIVKSIRS